ncbi:hypothetical protein [Anabaena sp. CCY 9402-a]|uniref:hypothetical protein n=1 Tax=Anabaena sp. CCY 9402-a TaxID=3103867 RepID=UPI0039C7303B
MISVKHLKHNGTNDDALFPASPPRNRVITEYIGQSFHLHQIESSTNFIASVGWCDYLRIGYRDSSHNESHVSLLSAEET